MKQWVRLLNVLVIVVAVCATLIHQGVSQGNLRSRFFYASIFPALQRLHTALTDIKFRVRGPTQPKNKIVILDIDSNSIEKFGRWPWSRDLVSILIENTFALGARAVGLDIVFSEPQVLIPEELQGFLKRSGNSRLISEYDVDARLEKTMETHRDNLTLAWITESNCRPFFENEKQCPVTSEDSRALVPVSFEKFSFSKVKHAKKFEPSNTPLMSVPYLISNLSRFEGVAKYSGCANGFRDMDGVNRRTSLVYVVNGQPHPSFALAMAESVWKGRSEVGFDSEFRLSSLSDSLSNPLFASPLGIAEINYRGPDRTFEYISAEEVFRAMDENGRTIASESLTKSLKDSIVLVGISALALSDIAANPFSGEIPGVEIHASILDNVLSNDFLTSYPNGGFRFIWIGIIILGGLFFGMANEPLTAKKTLALFWGTLCVLFFIDTKLFNRGFNAFSAAIYFEFFALSLISLVAKYLAEEQKKQFLRFAFSKYVSPAVVDLIVSDSSRLSVGGQREELSILFTDIRNFTTHAEKLDARAISKFLNDYLTIMTDVVFRHGGTLDKYIGDAIMAFWGAPISQQDHAVRTCRATVEMFKVLHDNHERFEKEFGIPVNIGAGINTGFVNVGNMGSDKSFGYTVIGDEVNLASRLESATKQFGVGILTTRQTVDAIEKTSPSEFIHRSLGDIVVKGKVKPVEIFQLFYRTVNTDALSAYRKGLRLFRDHQFREAKTFFEISLTGLNPGESHLDKVSQHFIENCNRFAAKPPTSELELAWHLETK